MIYNNMTSFLENELKFFNFNIKKINEDIILVKNFISQEELKYIFDIINNTTEDDWRIEYLSNLKNFCMEKFGRDDVDNLVAEGKFEITQNWEDKNFNISHTDIQKIIYHRLDNLVKIAKPEWTLSGFATIQRMQEGVELKSHTDQDTDPSIKYATILYLNDEYNNGEVFFPNLDVELKPEPTSLLLFPGTKEYEHGVKHVGAGPIRYVLVGFIKEKNFYDHNKY
jgi:hypothetical protein